MVFLCVCACMGADVQSGVGGGLSSVGLVFGLQVRARKKQIILGDRVMLPPPAMVPDGSGHC